MVQTPSIHPVASPQAAQVAALASLADALLKSAARLKNRAALSAEFLQLLVLAKQIVTKAWDVRTSRWAFDENTGRLADELQRFSEQASLASRHAAAAIERDAGMVESLRGHSHRISDMIDQGDRGITQADIRAELEPLEHTLVGLQARLGEERRVSMEAATLALGAAGIAEATRGLRGGGRVAEQALGEIHRGLTAFVADATMIAQRMVRSSTGLTEETVRMAAGTRDALVRRTAAIQPGHPVVWSHGPRPS